MEKLQVKIINNSDHVLSPPVGLVQNNYNLRHINITQKYYRMQKAYVIL